MPHFNRLPAAIRPGLVNYPGRTAHSQHLVEHLLEEDREKHHSFFNRGFFHNHLSHHILAAYDLGAPAPLLQAIYDSEKSTLLPVVDDKHGKGVEEIDVVNLTKENWTTWLGQKKYYAAYLVFFTDQTAAHGPAKVIQDYIFAESANANGAHMLTRFIGGLYHPLIQTGYGVEFDSAAMVAQGLAQTAVSDAGLAVLFDASPATVAHPTERPGPLPLLEILRQAYDSPILKPAMPYDPNANLSKRLIDTCKDGRPEEIRRIASLWWATFTASSPAPVSAQEIDRKVEELFYLSTLLLVGTSKPNRIPRLDFNLMHVLTSTLFIPPILKVLTSPNKELLLQTMLEATLFQVVSRGRPRLNPALVMKEFTPLPRPPVVDKGVVVGNAGSVDVIGPGEECINPWPEVIEASLHAPDAHVPKTIRSLLYAARLYGATPAGEVPGAFKIDAGKKEETHVGMKMLDGTVFVRAAGVVIDVLGWLNYGQNAGNWDRSCLGYEEAWEGDEGK